MNARHPAPHRVGIIGLGVMGRTMLAAMAGHPRFEVVGAYDPMQSSDGMVKLFAAAEALVADPNLDLIYVASPPAHHMAGVALAAAARKPLLCEKPLAPSVDEARRCLALVERAGVASAVNFYLAASDAGVRMRRLVLDGALGRIESAHLTLRFREWPRSWQKTAGAWLAGPAEGGFTREVASHFLFQMHRMFGAGRIEASQVWRGRSGTETAVKARIGYRDVTLEINAATGGDRDDHNRLAIRGTKARAAIVDWDVLEVDGATADAPVPETFMLDSLAAMMSGQAHELASFAEAVEVVALTESLLAGGGTIEASCAGQAGEEHAGSH
jgi:predicted dehydrogenase